MSSTTRTCCTSSSGWTGSTPACRTRMPSSSSRCLRPPRHRRHRRWHSRRTTDTATRLARSVATVRRRAMRRSNRRSTALSADPPTGRVMCHRRARDHTYSRLPGSAQPLPVRGLFNTSPHTNHRDNHCRFASFPIY